MQTYFGKPILIRFASCVFDWFTCLHREGQGIKRKRRLGTTICMSNLKWGAASSIWRRKRSIPTVKQCPVFYIRQQMVLMQKYPHLNPESEMITFVISWDPNQLFILFMFIFYIHSYFLLILLQINCSLFKLDGPINIKN